MTDSRSEAGSPPPTVSVSPPSYDPLLEQLRAATVGTYQVYGELGRGGMATVYLAHDISLDRKVAIKVMSPAMMHGPGMSERFKREARTAAQLSHPNIIPVYSVREAEGLLLFVMKLVEGTPLDAIIREVGKLPLPMVEALLAQVGGALGYAHRHGVVHRDIKPSNILIDDEGWVVVTDFGIAKVKETEGLTQSGVAVGTPTYMSPEQCGGGEITGASDQYSLGIVAYEMLAGRPPFTGPATMPIMYSHFHDAPPPLDGFRPDCPPQLREAVSRMLAKDPAARFPTMEEAVVALGGRQLAHDDPTRSHLILLARSGQTHRVVSQVQTPRSPIPLGNRGKSLSGAQGAVAAAPARRIWLFGAVAAVAAAAAAVTVLSMQRESTPPVVNPPAVVAADSVVTPPRPPPASIPAADSSGAASVTPERPTPPAATRPGDRAAARNERSAVPQPRITAPAPARDTTPVVVVVPPAPAPPPPAPPPPPPPPVVRAESAAAPPARVVDDRADVSSAIMAYARALDQGDLTQARRLYPGMTPEQRQDLEAFWNAAGTMRTQWTVSDVVVEGDVATARVRGSTLVTLARQRPSEQGVNLRARLERRGTEWRLVALIN
jgi:eukaryotic-like serine/threonine-protein kinase